MTLCWRVNVWNKNIETSAFVYFRGHLYDAIVVINYFFYDSKPNSRAWIL